MKTVDAKKIRFWQQVYNLIIIGISDDKDEPRHILLEPQWLTDDSNEPGQETLTLGDIAAQFPANGCLTVIAEGPIEGNIYRYNNYGNREWLEVGTTCGYA